MSDDDLACTDCGYDTFGNEYYMVRNDVWERALGHKEDGVVLCIGCLEKRIGRTLTRWDFTDCPLNTMSDWPRSARLRSRLRRGAMIDLALAFAHAGFPIFPVNVFHQRDRWRKVPHVVKWANAATTDATLIAQWWRQWPLAMPGVPLARCDCVVVDCDCHPGAADGLAELRKLGPLPLHPVVATKSGGEHHYFRQPPERITRHDWCDGIEVLGTSSFVVGYALPQGAMPEL
jgi:hypothetical protein